MSNFTSKKTKTINSNSLIKNQISNILQPFNGIIAITQPTNKILTQNAVSSNYYIPLLEKITGEQSITARVPLAFRTDIVTEQMAYNIGQNWLNSTHDFGTNNKPTSICWSPELGLFCCGLDSTRIANSIDGLTWNILSTQTINNDPAGAFGNSNDICWSPELRIFVVIAYNNRLCATSPDGFTWTYRPSLNTLSTSDGHNIRWGSVCWSRELGRFCAVGNDAGAAFNTKSEAINNYCVALSSDGINWNLSTSGVKNYYWAYVCWSAELGLFCAVSFGSASSNRIMVSRDGYNWSNATNGNGSYNYIQVCWSPELGLFCAVGNNGIVVSRNGYDWSPSISGVRNTSWAGVCWSPELGLFCAVSPTLTVSGNDEVIISRDGYNWREATSGVAPIGWGSVCWSPELSIFCSLSYSGTNTRRAMITNPIYRLPTTKSIQTLTNDGYYNINIKSTASDNFPPDYYNNNVNMIKIGNNSFFDLSYISFNETFDNGTTRGTFNWDLSANNGDTTTQITNPGTYLSMLSWNTVGFKSINLPIAYSSTKFKNISFNISIANGRNITPFLLGISDNISIFNATNKIGFSISSIAANDGSMNILVNVNNTNVTTLTSLAYPNTQYILNMDFFSNYIVFSLANANTPTIIIGSYTLTSMPNYNSYIGAYFSSNTAVGNSRYAYIHDIKWTLSSDITTFDNSISIGDTNKQAYTSYVVNKYSNIGIGKNIFPTLTSGFQNIGIGNAIATSMATGHNNVFIGNGVATSITSTGNTVAIGTNAGRTNTTGINNTYLGAFTDASLGTYSNSTAIGFGAVIGASNEIVLGTLTEHVRTPGNPYWYSGLSQTNKLTFVAGVRIAIAPAASTFQNSFSNRITIFNTYFLVVPEFAFGIYRAQLSLNLNTSTRSDTYDFNIYQYAIANAITSNIISSGITPITPVNFFVTQTFEFAVPTYTNDSSIDHSCLFQYAPGTTNRAFLFTWRQIAGSGDLDYANGTANIWSWITLYKIA